MWLKGYDYDTLVGMYMFLSPAAEFARAKCSCATDLLKYVNANLESRDPSQLVSPQGCHQMLPVDTYHRCRRNCTML